MAITITNNKNTITIDWGDYSENLEKSELLVTHNGDYVTLSTKLVEHKFLYSTITTPTYASGALMEAGINTMINNTGIQSQVFIATAGQTIFTPVFTPTAGNTYITIGGISVIGGWSIVGVTIVFVTPMTGGEEVVIFLM